MRHLRLLKALGDHEHLGRAAEFLAMTQPAASRLLAELEILVGEELFRRTPQGMVPTLYGEVLVRRARAMLVELRHAAEEVRDLQAGHGSVVALGAVTAPAVGPVLDAVHSVQAENPRLRITVEVDSSPSLLQRLLESHLDIILARMPEGVDYPMLDCIPVREEEVVFLVRNDHALLRRRSLALADLVGYPWAIQPAGTPMRQRVEAEFRRVGSRMPEQALSTPSVLLTLAAVMRGKFIGAVSREVAAIFHGKGAFRQLKLVTDLPQLIFEPYSLVRHRERSFSPAATIVYAALTRHLFEAAI